MPMFAVPFTRSEEWNEFRRRADGNLVWSSRSSEQEDTVSAIQASSPIAEQETAIHLQSQFWCGVRRVKEINSPYAPSFQEAQ
jgi:hypothetical protein